jgi:hypothetical protein
MATDYGRITEALVVLITDLNHWELNVGESGAPLWVNIGRNTGEDNELFALVEDENDKPVATFRIRVERVEVAG